jgi:isochorismate synthase
LHYPEHKTFTALIHKAEKQLKNSLPFVLYRKPREASVSAMFQQDTTTHFVRDFSESGFIFAPFNSKAAVILLRPDDLMTAHFEGFEVPERKNRIQPYDDKKGKHFFEEIVRKGIDTIHSGKLQKVVLSHCMEVPLQRKPLEIFQQLLHSYPAAFCYCWYHPKIGLWLGATPELFMSMKKSKFLTVSLAGTQKYKSEEEPLWGTKELEEQELVTRYIKVALQDKVSDLSTSKVQSVRAGALWHLHTAISASAESGEIGSIIRALHPTAAVCGMPLQKARIFVQENENYDRSFYTGYLGELNVGMEPESYLYVNLRCMQLKDEKAIIYVGAGITKDSEPEREWQETIDKSKTMLNVL